MNVAELLRQVDRFRASTVSDGTKQHYESYQKEFLNFLEANELEEICVHTISIFIAHCNLELHNCYGTLKNKLTAISKLCKIRGINPNPCMDVATRDMMNGIRRTTKGDSKPNKKTGFTTTDIENYFQIPLNKATYARNRLLLSLCFIGMLRISEAINLDHEDIKIINNEHGTLMQITINSSKTDQFGETTNVFIGKTNLIYDTIDAYYKWIEHSGLNKGPVFVNCSIHGEILTTRITYNGAHAIIKKISIRLGYDPKIYGTHSLRRGGAHELSLHDVSESSIRTQGRWKSEIYKNYIDKTEMEAGNEIAKKLK